MLLNPPKAVGGKAPYKVYNIGNNKPEKLMYFFETLEKCLGMASLMDDYGFKTSIEEGDGKLVNGYVEYYSIGGGSESFAVAFFGGSVK